MQKTASSSSGTVSRRVERFSVTLRGPSLFTDAKDIGEVRGRLRGGGESPRCQAQDPLSLPRPA